MRAGPVPVLQKEPVAGGNQCHRGAGAETAKGEFGGRERWHCRCRTLKQYDIRRAGKDVPGALQLDGEKGFAARAD